MNYKNTTSILALCAVLYTGTVVAAPVSEPKTISLEVAAQRLDHALTDLAQQAGFQLLIQSEDVQGKKTKSLMGLYTHKQALDLLLEDTGLVYSYVDAKTIAIRSISKGFNFQSISYNTNSDYTASLSVYEGDERADEVDAFELDEIVVTASRREQKLQDVPMAITAVKPEEFTAVGLTRLGDIIAYTPGVTSTDRTGSPAGSAVSARGVAEQQGQTATVGIYMDTVPLSSNSPWGNGGSFAFDGLLGDIERIEFLKGPQGTLYGATSVGGAIKYITRKPSLDGFRGHASVDFSSTKNGGFNQIYNGRISTPIVEDKLGITVAGFYEDNGGLIDRLDATSGALLLKNADRYEKYGFSGDLYYKVTDRFDFRARVLHQKSEFNGLSRIDIDPATKESANGPFANISPFAESSYKNTYYSGALEYQFDWATITATSSYVEEGLFDAADLGAATAASFDAFVDPFIEGGVATPSTSAPFFNRTGSEKFTQEIQLTSEASETWEWIIGLYYADETTFSTFGILLLPDNINVQSTQRPSDYKEYATFGNLTYYITPELDVTVGARLSRSEMTFSPIQTSVIPFLNIPLFINPIKDTANTWSFSARYRPTEDMSLYARVASGYRPASANESVSFEGVSLPLLIESDKLWSYELGAKGNLADGMISYDLALWYLNWDNFQADIILSQFVGGKGNAPGGITAKGVEGSFTLKPVDGLSIISNFSYTDSTLNEDEPELNALAGQQLAFVPKWTFSSRASYSFALNSDVDTVIGAGVRYQGSTRSGFTDDGAFVPGVDDEGGTFDTVINVPTDAFIVMDMNASLTWDQFSLNFYATNLLNEKAITGTRASYSNISNSVGQSIGVPLKPRTIGARLSVDF